MRPSDPAADILAGKGSEPDAGPDAAPKGDGAMARRAVATGIGGADLGPATGRSATGGGRSCGGSCGRRSRLNRARTGSSGTGARELTPAALDAAVALDRS